MRSSWALLCVLSLWAISVRADDQPFLSLYTTDIDGQGEREVEQWLGWKTAATGGSYNDFLSRSQLSLAVGQGDLAGGQVDLEGEGIWDVNIEKKE